MADGGTWNAWRNAQVSLQETPLLHVEFATNEMFCTQRLSLRAMPLNTPPGWRVSVALLRVQESLEVLFDDTLQLRVYAEGPTFSGDFRNELNSLLSVEKLLLELVEFALLIFADLSLKRGHVPELLCTHELSSPVAVPYARTALYIWTFLQ